jgi:hypothetical protein
LQVASELKLYRIHVKSFAEDGAPLEVRERLAQGVSLLLANGGKLSRTIETLKKRGAIEVINRMIEGQPVNFHLLRKQGKAHLAAEAIALEFPHLFRERILQIAMSRLSIEKDEPLGLGAPNYHRGQTENRG